MGTWPPRAGFDADHDAFRASVRQFIAREVAPALAGWRTSGGAPASFFRIAGESGLLGTTAPESLGGGGVEDLRFVVVLVEEIAACGAVGLAHVIALHSGVCLPMLLRSGPAPLVPTLVPSLVDGTVLAVPVAAGSPVRSRPHGDGLVLSGAAAGVPGAAVADLLLVQVAGDGLDGVVALGPSAAGVHRYPVPDALGGLDAGQADLRFEEANSASADLLRDAAGPQLLRELDLWAAVVATAAAQSVLDLTLGYVADRRVFGRLLKDLPNTRDRIAVTGSRLAATRLLVDACISARVEDTLTDGAAAGARIDAAALHDETVDVGLQLHGGYGYMREYAISHAYADAQYLRDQERCGSHARDRVAASLGM